MWKRHLNSKVLVITTHRKLGEMSDRTSTQVISQTIDKYMVKMIPRELYNIKNPLWKGIKEILGKRITSLFTIVRSENWSIWTKSSSDWESVPICLWILIQIFFETCDNCCPNSRMSSFPTHFLQIYYLGLIGPLYYTFGPQIETLHK